MTDKKHWPFDSDDKGHRESEHPQELERSRHANESVMRQRARHDRFIVGGRAHNKKQGLS